MSPLAQVDLIRTVGFYSFACVQPPQHYGIPIETVDLVVQPPLIRGEWLQGPYAARLEAEDIFSSDLLGLTPSIWALTITDPWWGGKPGSMWYTALRQFVESLRFRYGAGPGSSGETDPQRRLLYNGSEVTKWPSN